MPPAVAIAAVAVGVAAVGTVATISAQNKAAKAQKKQFAYQRQIDNLRAARERTQAIRAARISQGQVTQTAVNQGASGTSASLGGIGSIQSQLAGTLSFLDQTNFLSDQATIQAGKAAAAMTKAANASAITGLAMQVFSMSGSFGGGAPKGPSGG